MRFMQKGIHLGKIVVPMPEDHAELRGQSMKPGIQLDKNAAYLLVGGLGGLGQAIAVWMAEAGAGQRKQCIIFASNPS